MTTQEMIDEINLAIQDETKSIQTAVIILSTILPAIDETLIQAIHDQVSVL